MNFTSPSIQCLTECTRQALTVAFLFFVGIAAAQDGSNQLLGASTAAALDVRWKQDGRVVELSVGVPDGPWVVQKLDLFATVKRRPKIPQAKGKKLSPEEFLEQIDVEDMLRVDSSYTVKTSAFPGRTTKVRLELRTDEPLDKIAVKEAWGRELTRFERARRVFE